MIPRSCQTCGGGRLTPVIADIAVTTTANTHTLPRLLKQKVTAPVLLAACAAPSALVGLATFSAVAARLARGSMPACL
jgi:hypothetical protein